MSKLVVIEDFSVFLNLQMMLLVYEIIISKCGVLSSLIKLAQFSLLYQFLFIMYLFIYFLD